MKHKAAWRVFCMLLAVVLCTTAFSVSAFAASTEDHTESTATTGAAQETAPPYEIKTNADGTVTVTVSGKSWTFDPNDKESTIQVGTVVNVSSYLHLRSGAGMSEKIIGHLLNGDKVEVVGQDGNWYKVVVPEQTGYVYGKYLKVAETVATNADGEVDKEMLAMLLALMSASGSSTPRGTTSTTGNMTGTVSIDNSNGLSLTPNGNLSLLDDIGATKTTGQQFITFETKSGNTFYMVIDRNDKGEENVHFLNLVDEADLLALMEDDQKPTTPIVCSCKEKCVAGKVDTTCPICKNNLTECTGKEKVEPTPEPTEPVKEGKSGGGSAIVLVLLLLVAGGGAAAYFFYLKPQQGKHLASNLDDLDLEDEEEYLDEDTEESE